MVEIFAWGVVIFVGVFFVLPFIFAIPLGFYLDATKQGTINCPYCGKKTTVWKNKTNCSYCQQPILFKCSLCGNTEKVDGYDMYDILHNDTAIVCKKCKALDMRKGYREYRPKKFKEKISDIFYTVYSLRPLLIFVLIVIIISWFLIAFPIWRISLLK